MEPMSPDVIWIVVVSFILALFLAFGVGANDVANSFGTSVGSKVLTLRQACIIATVFETLGAIMLGYKVSDTVRKGILDVNIYNNSAEELMLGNMAALGGSAVWNIAATMLKLPISGTHSIVGAVIGFTLVARGTRGIKWVTVGKIVGSWFVSPILSGLISIAFFLIVKFFILKKEMPLKPGLMMLPLFYGFTVFVNVFSIVHDGPHFLKFDLIPWWGVLILSLGLALIVAALVRIFVVPHIKNKVLDLQDPVKEHGAPSDSLVEGNKMIGRNYQADQTNGTMQLKNGGGKKSSAIEEERKKIATTKSNINHSVESSLQLDTEDENELNDKDEDSKEVSALFSSLQILTATFGSFVHGGNDVSNCVGPLIAVWLIFQDGYAAARSPTPIYLLLYGGIGISIGLWICGRRVIETMGTDLTKITPSSGFTIEVGAAFTVLLASKIGLPISTTHCKVGSVVMVGRVRSNTGVDWSLFRNIVLAWLVTLPISGGLTAALMAILRLALIK